MGQIAATRRECYTFQSKNHLFVTQLSISNEVQVHIRKEK